MEYDLRHGVQNLEANGICPVIKALYKTNPGHSEPWTHILSLRMSDPARAVNLYRPCAHLSQEDVVAKVFAKHGLRLDVDMSAGRVAKNPSHPYIRASSWIKAVDAGGNLGNLLGLGPGCSTLEQAAPALRSFWDKYALWHSDHEVYSLARAGKLSLEQCVPVYVHGDEGTAFKRDGALVLSFFSPIGKGVVCQKVGDIIDGSLHMNFRGNCFKTRFVMGTLFKAPHFKLQSMEHTAHLYGFLSKPKRLMLAASPLARKIMMITQPQCSSCWDL